MPATKDFARASQCLRESIALLRKIAPPRQADLADCLARLAQLHLEEKKLDDARPLLAEAIDLWSKTEANRPSVRIGAIAALSWIYMKQGDADKRKELLQVADPAAVNRSAEAEVAVANVRAGKDEGTLNEDS